jgi:Immunity protein 26
VRARVKYREGDRFAVPLRDGGSEVGLIVRANPKAALLGYFFGPARPEVPALDDVASLEPGDGVLVRKLGYLGTVQGKWPLLGRVDGWDRRVWPMPVFVRHKELTGRSFRVFYDDDDPNRVLREEQVTPDEAEQGPRTARQMRPDGSPADGGDRVPMAERSSARLLWHTRTRDRP